MKNYKIENREVSKLIPYVNNSRIHGNHQVKQIAASITEFGFTSPLLIDSLNNVIAGHGRLLACELLGIKEVPCVLVAGLTEAQKKALVIADNKIAENSDWDMELLKVEIEGLKDLDFDIDLLGFGETEIEAISGGEIDLSILDEFEDEAINEMESNVKKAIQIEFESGDYDRARDIISFWRQQGADIGAMIIFHLEAERDKL